MVKSFHMGLSCKNPILIEKFYVKYFGFRRARVYDPGPNQVVMIKLGQFYLELFPATENSPVPEASEAGQNYPGWKHLAFKVDSIEHKLQELGELASLTLGPLEMDSFIKGMKVCWIKDPEGNIVELSEGYSDELDPPQINMSN